MPTPKKYPHKLVRDRIPELIKAAGGDCFAHQLDTPAFIHALKTKLFEECQELFNAPPENLVDELADIFEVLDAFCQLHKISRTAVAEAAKKKRNERGGFKQRLLLVWTQQSTLPPGDT